jgi:hypothetical protein
MRYFKCFIAASSLALAGWSVLPAIGQSADVNRPIEKIDEALNFTNLVNSLRRSRWLSKRW